MNDDDLKKLANHNRNVVMRNKAKLNKPTKEETSQNVFQHTTDEEITMDDVQVNGLIDKFASMYREKWGSSVNMKSRDFKIDDIKEFMSNNKLSVDDMENYIDWLFRGRLTRQFKGNLGCLHSQSMYDEWKDKKAASTGTSPERFREIAAENIKKWERRQKEWAKNDKENK